MTSRSLTMPWPLWHGDQSPRRKHREIGAKMYFVRLQIAHIFEALAIAKDMQEQPLLRDALADCDKRTSRSFARVIEFIGTDDHAKMLRIRNNITFHYGAKVVEKAMRAVAKSQPDTPLTISLGRATIDWFFAPADRIIDHIVVRDIFEVPNAADVREEVDKIIVRLQEMGGVFADFAGYFVWRHANCL